MTTSKISALTDLGAAPASTDLVPIVDVSDATQAASGSTKKNLVSDFFLWLLATARTFTAAPVFETGAAGASPAIFRQTGGVAGTDDFEVSHDGSKTLLCSKSGYIQVNGASTACQIFFNRTDFAATGYVGIDGTGVMAFDFYSATQFNAQFRVKSILVFGSGYDVALSRAAAGVIRVSDASTGGGVIEFGQVSDVPTPASNSANIGAEDVAGTAEMIVSDEAGTETQISEHRSDGPNWLYDDVAVTGMLDRIEYERQRYLGTHRYFNVSRFRRLMAAGTPITSAPGLPTTCEFVETFAQWHARCPEKVVIQKRDWDTDQAAKQAKYDADRQAELDRVAEIQAAHAKALSDYAKLPAAEKAKRPAPVAPELPAVRPAKDIKKPKPSWIK